MQDKEMVNDILGQVKASLTKYAMAISECNNQQLRQTLVQIRNSDEQFQQQLASLAMQKGYYVPAQPATPQEIQQVYTQVH